MQQVYAGGEKRYLHRAPTINEQFFVSFYSLCTGTSVIKHFLNENVVHVLGMNEMFEHDNNTEQIQRILSSRFFGSAAMLATKRSSGVAREVN